MPSKKPAAIAPTSFRTFAVPGRTRAAAGASISVSRKSDAPSRAVMRLRILEGMASLSLSRPGEEPSMSEQLLQDLRTALGHIDRPGSFCVQGSVPAILPGLEVADLGPVGLPLTAAQAKELVKQCEQAPYGKGEETLVDTSVRRVWRLTP